MSRSPLLCLLLTVLALLFSGGCADDLRNRSVFDVGAGEATLLFSVENISLTRSGEDMESRIDHAYLLFYEPDVNPENRLPVAAVKAVVSESEPSALSFKMPLSLTPNTDYRIIAIANADSYVPEGFSSFKDYLDAWCSTASEDRQPLLLFHSDPVLGSEVVCLPMQGAVVDGLPFRFSMQNGGYRMSVSLSFRRAVGRVDVANIVKEGFEIEGIALCNWRDAVSAVSYDPQLGNRLGSVCGILSDENSDGFQPVFVEMPPADDSGIQQLKEAFYCFPSVAYDSYPSDRESTALLIKARYGEDEASSYYRVNVGIKGNRSEVKANTKYLVTVQSVKESGASTPEEAYAADDSPIVLSVVEDWDLEGCFAMDDDGNFIVLSTGRMEFKGDAVDGREVRILTSKGLAWTVDYIADNESSASAFAAKRLSDVALAISPTGENRGEESLAGRFKVSAMTPGGGSLSVDIYAVQNPAKETEIPDVPDDMPFALVPVSTDRVKIDHNERTIEIDGFDPDCMNSFIDVPFRIYLNPNKDIQSVNVSSTLLWPLEGRLSLEPSGQYTYCNESFDPQGSGKVCDSNGAKIEFSSLFSSSITQRIDGDVVYVSVGAMGPDDPAIPRQITLSSLNEETVTYQLKVAPRDAIIYDVILTDGDGNSWFVMDRNILSTKDSNKTKYFGRDENGYKWQAYNWSSNSKLTIPFKYESENVAFSETKHSLFQGEEVLYYRLSNFTARRTDWLNRCKYSNVEDPSPQFYDSDNYTSWVFPTKDVLELCCEKMKVSKLRLFLLSDVPAINGNDEVPVCCYWPCKYLNDEPSESAFYRWGYCFTENSDSQITPSSIFFMFYNGEKVVSYDWTLNNYDDSGLGRLVRPLTTQELNDYKSNYLGYGSNPHRMKLCHPDTYTSEGWIAY